MKHNFLKATAVLAATTFSVISCGPKQAEWSGWTNPVIEGRYADPEGDRLVLVGVNSGFRDEDISLRLPPVVRRKVSAVKVFRTDSRTDLSIVGSSERVPSSITARQSSITTIAIDL